MTEAEQPQRLEADALAFISAVIKTSKVVNNVSKNGG